MEDHPSKHQEPAWVEDNALGEVGQVADFFKAAHLLPGQLCHGLTWLAEEDRQKHVALEHLRVRNSIDSFSGLLYGRKIQV